jgi:hypothetical protein
MFTCLNIMLIIQITSVMKCDSWLNSQLLVVHMQLHFNALDSRAKHRGREVNTPARIREVQVEI